MAIHFVLLLIMVVSFAPSHPLPLEGAVVRLTNYRQNRQAPYTTTLPPTTTIKDNCGGCPAGQRCILVYPSCTTPPPNCNLLKAVDPSRSCEWPCKPFNQCGYQDIWG
ncbi:unnamed protein product [Lymnaea stagnalis]|uniref:Uncharacterized protein n=1 Tax=Lymnaea stagnalis TaxID=6523 RepID=A0AAV2IBH5_LYMST